MFEKSLFKAVGAEEVAAWIVTWFFLPFILSAWLAAPFLLVKTLYFAIFN